MELTCLPVRDPLIKGVRIDVTCHCPDVSLLVKILVDPSVELTKRGSLPCSDKMLHRQAKYKLVF
jgi:hypothetical protein